MGEHCVKYAPDWQQIIKACLLALLGFVLLCAAFSGSRTVWGVQMKSAVVMAVSISHSADQFLADYGSLPLPTGNAPAGRDLDADTGSASGLVAVLTGKEPASSSTKPQNPGGVDYLEGIKPAKQLKPTRSKIAPPWANGLMTEGTPPQYSIMDAWGNLYHLRLDTDGDGWVENPDPLQVADGRTKLKKRVHRLVRRQRWQGCYLG